MKVSYMKPKSKLKFYPIDLDRVYIGKNENNHNNKEFIREEPKHREE